MLRLWRRLRRSAHVHDDVGERFRRHLDVGKILDIPAGRGENARNLVASGYEVCGADLAPEHCAGQGYRVDEVDMTEPLPYESGSFDGVLHSEGIEHVDPQVAVLAELARVLRPGGVLIVTTPNLLHLEGRLATLFSGHAYRNRAMVVETAAYWGKRGNEARGTAGTYFGHVFLINAFQLRFYLIHVGLEIVEVDTTRYSLLSVLLAPFLYPFVWLSTRRLLAHRRSFVPPDLQRELRRQMLSPAILFGRKVIMTARKPLETPGGQGLR